MPDSAPSNAPDDLAPKTGDTAAKQLGDTGGDTGPGGGGLGGAAAAAADPLGGSARAPSGTSPNSPIDLGVADPDAEGDAATREAQLRSLADGPAEPDRSSR